MNVVSTDGSSDLRAPCPAVFINARHGHGVTGQDGYLGIGDLRITNAFGFIQTIGAHPPADITIEVRRSVRLRGFLNGTADYCAGVEFRVDGVSMGLVRSAYDITPEVVLAPGRHLLTTVAEGSDHACHSAWGFDGADWLDATPEHYAVIGAICKDENEYLEEWVRHHLAVGIGHVYLLDNGSREPLKRAIEAAGLQSVVTVEDFPASGPGTQETAYLYLLRKYGPACRWMALIDIDELIIPRISTGLPRLLSAFEEYGGLAVPWIMFGACGREEKAADHLAAYTESCTDHHVKCIVQPRFVESVQSAHGCGMMPGRPTVGEHFDAKPSTQHIQINHYWTRSRGEWEGKISRGAVVPGYERSWADFHAHQERCQGVNFAAMEWRRAREQPLPQVTQRIVGFLHVAPVKHWQADVENQLNRTKRSGLYDRTEKIYLGLVGVNRSDAAVAELLRDFPAKLEFVVMEPNLEASEFPTLAALRKWCSENEGFVWYMHTKGVVHSHPHQKNLRSKMEEFALVHHELAAGRLARGSPVAAGFGSFDLPGSFWWARSDHIASLPCIGFLNQSDRHQAETWVALKGTHLFYIHDYGDWAQDGWEITDAETGAGVATTSGYHGWERVPVLPPKGTPPGVLISAHAPSVVAITTTVPLLVRGFTSGSSQAAAWQLEFSVNGTSLGKTREVWWSSMEVLLPPGRHHLRALLTGEMWGAHSSWSVRRAAVQDSGTARAVPCAGKSAFLDLTIRTDILRSLVELRGYKSYLEIGLGDGGNFRRIPLIDKTSVDPEGTPTRRMTSDQFFSENTRRFDLIFIDGLHEAETVIRDVQNALRVLNPGGAVVCHDVKPSSELMQRVPRESSEWTGDVWKAWVRLRCMLPGSLMTVCDTDYGVGVIIPDALEPNPLTAIPEEDLTWESFEIHSSEWLHLEEPTAAWNTLITGGWDMKSTCKPGL